MAGLVTAVATRYFFTMHWMPARHDGPRSEGEEAMSATAASSPVAHTTTQPSKGLHIALWVVQVLLAAAFLMAGGMKLTAPIEELAKNMAWVSAVPPGLVRFIGLSEVAGALGLILPAATRIKPSLTGVAGAALVVVMVLAMGMHISRGEYPFLGGPVVLAALSAFVAWGRLKKAPIAPRA
jgi:putative oxidoreductase